MAKARATCTCATCGATFEKTTIKQNTREASRWEEWAAENIIECDECREKRIAAQRADESAQAAAAASDRGWPELIGTEKQVAWANTIRENAIAEMTKAVRSSMKEQLNAAIRVLVTEKRQASWWIDNRNYSALSMTSGIRAAMNEILRRDPSRVEEEAKAQEEAEQDSATIAEPENRSHEGIVDITAGDQRVEARYQKDDAFREVVKGLGYTWSSQRGSWSMSIGVTTGSAQERAAELGNKLLNAGFAIRIQDRDTLEKAIRGEYEPRCRRWVTWNFSLEVFSLEWERNESIYQAARRLPGARYSSPCILVPLKEYKAVIDFAETYGFRLSPGAQKHIEEMRGTTVIVAPAPAKEPQYEEHPTSEILESSREIIEDLKEAPAMEKKNVKYRIMVKTSGMDIVGIPMWKDVTFDTRLEAEEALEKAKKEIEETWAYPKGTPVWIETV